MLSKRHNVQIRKQMPAPRTDTIEKRESVPE